MTKATTKTKVKLLPFDAARYLTDDAAVAEYVTAVLETDDADLLLLALGDMARARGMAQVAKDAGLGRESSIKLSPPAQNRDSIRCFRLQRHWRFDLLRSLCTSSGRKDALPPRAWPQEF